jgi:class 3 adenylate cyclase
MSQVDLDALLSQQDEHVRSELSNKPEVVEAGDSLDLADLFIDARKWYKLDEVVAVVADLKNSSALDTGNQQDASTASIYEAAVHPLVKILDGFDADDIAIQGDGAFGVFWGEDRFERALCAGITVKTFSEKFLEPRLEKKWPEAPTTGYKVGVACSRVLVKRVGVPRSDHQEEVWAGKAVNYAAKAAHTADRREMIVTDPVWERALKNDYLALSCGCWGGPSNSIWQDIEITQLPDEEASRYGRKLTSHWCDECGAEFCAAVLDGKRKRDDVRQARSQMEARLRESALRQKAANARERSRGLASLR